MRNRSIATRHRWLRVFRDVILSIHFAVICRLTGSCKSKGPSLQTVKRPKSKLGGRTARIYGMTLAPKSGVGAGNEETGEGDQGGQLAGELLSGESTARGGALCERLDAAVAVFSTPGGGEPLRGVVIGLTKWGGLGIGIGGSLGSRGFRETTRAVIGPDAALNWPTTDSVPSPLSFRLM